VRAAKGFGGQLDDLRIIIKPDRRFKIVLTIILIQEVQHRNLNALAAGKVIAGKRPLQ
jgi:hypothetical protein